MQKAKVKFFFWLLATFLLVTVSIAEAQQPKKVPRIGFVVTTGDAKNPSYQVEAFRQGLGEWGYVEGKNILIDYRYVEGRTDQIASFVTEFLKLKVDIMVLTNPPAIRAAKQATEAIPIIMVTSDEPVSAGVVNNLARPGGNITGVTRLTRELSGKRLELLKEVVPRLSRVGVLWGTTSGRRNNFQIYESAARALKIELQSLDVRAPNPDLDGAFQAAAKGRVNALAIVRTALLTPHSKRIADLARNYRLPSMFESDDFVEAGGLMSYATNDAESYKRAAWMVDKILKGTKPADIPVEQATKFEFVINLKTAKQIGLTISPNVLALADKVIR
jgi:putative tryptophan/tyrosine transport system substrate-binding protein